MGYVSDKFPLGMRGEESTGEKALLAIFGAVRSSPICY